MLYVALDIAYALALYILVRWIWPVRQPTLVQRLWARTIRRP